MRSKSIAHSLTDRIPHNEFSLRTLMGTAFPQKHEVRAHWCLGSTQITQWIVRAAAALPLKCTYVLIHRSPCLPYCALQRHPVRVPGVIVRLCPLASPTGLQGQVKALRVPKPLF